MLQFRQQAAPTPTTSTPSTSGVVYFTSTEVITIKGGVTNSYVTIAPQTIHIAIPTCLQTITPDKNGYLPPGTCNALWDYYPSFGAALVFAALFGILVSVHICQAVAYKKVGNSPASPCSSFWDQFLFSITEVLLGDNHGCLLGDHCIHLSHLKHPPPAECQYLSGLSDFHSSCPIV